MKKYRQLALEQRYQISAFKQAGFSNSAIARKLLIDKSTVGRELRRNRSKRGYRPKMAHEKALARRREKVKPRITGQTWQEVQTALKQQWSPEQICGRRALENERSATSGFTGISIKTNERAARFIRICAVRNGDANAAVLIHVAESGAAKNGLTRVRPLVEQKRRLGDWELDTIIGKGNHQAMVTMVDRQSKLTRIRGVKRKTGTAVARAVGAGLHGLTVHTLTSDNGREFAEHEKIAKNLSAEFYFCHPYQARERCLNENTNGLIRQYFPKQTGFALDNPGASQAS